MERQSPQFLCHPAGWKQDILNQFPTGPLDISLSFVRGKAVGRSQRNFLKKTKKTKKPSETSSYECGEGGKEEQPPHWLLRTTWLLCSTNLSHQTCVYLAVMVLKRTPELPLWIVTSGGREHVIINGIT